MWRHKIVKCAALACVPLLEWVLDASVSSSVTGASGDGGGTVPAKILGHLVSIPLPEHRPPDSNPPSPYTLTSVLPDPLNNEKNYTFPKNAIFLFITTVKSGNTEDKFGNKRAQKGSRSEHQEKSTAEKMRRYRLRTSSLTSALQRPFLSWMFIGQWSLESSMIIYKRMNDYLLDLGS